jgi:hypothetical protein
MRNARLVLSVMAVVIVALILYRRAHPVRNSSTAPPGNNDMVLEVHSIPVFHSLNLGDFVVPAKGTHDVKISVDEGQMRNVRILGHFSTSNGPGIQVMVLDAIQYENFKRDRSPSAILYMSKTATSGDLAVAVPHGGAYYLVFDNSASEANANVKADLTLRYETVRVDSGADTKK